MDLKIYIHQALFTSVYGKLQVFVYSTQLHAYMSASLYAWTMQIHQEPTLKNIAP